MELLKGSIFFGYPLSGARGVYHTHTHNNHSHDNGNLPMPLITFTFLLITFLRLPGAKKRHRAIRFKLLLVPHKRLSAAIPGRV